MINTDFWKISSSTFWCLPRMQRLMENNVGLVQKVANSKDHVRDIIWALYTIHDMIDLKLITANWLGKLERSFQFLTCDFSVCIIFHKSSSDCVYLRSAIVNVVSKIIQISESIMRQSYFKLRLLIMNEDFVLIWETGSNRIRHAKLMIRYTTIKNRYQNQFFIDLLVFWSLFLRLKWRAVLVKHLPSLMNEQGIT